MKNILKRGFTIVELLVVISIIAILTAIIVTNFSQAKGKARDAKRVSDMNNLQLALELYFDRCKEYPQTLNADVSAPTCSVGHVNMNNFISTIPTPPGNPTVSPSPTDYDYVVNDSSKATDYFLHIKLENPSESIKDGMDFIKSKPSWYNGAIACSRVPGNLEYCVGAK